MRPTRFISFVASLSLLLFVGCDVFYGVERTTFLAKSPSSEQIKTALSAVAGVDRVEHRKISPTKMVVGNDEPAYDQYLYHCDDIGGVVDVRPTSNGQCLLRIYSLELNRKPSPQKVEAIRAKMDEVYASLQKSIPEMPAVAKEQFVNIPSNR